MMTEHVRFRARSMRNFSETLARLETAINARGLTLFARFDHAANAQAAGLDLRPTTVLVFGNPTAGTRLMQADQDVGLDLPLRILVGEDVAGAVYLLHGDPRTLLTRYDLGEASLDIANAMLRLLRDLTATAVA